MLYNLLGISFVECNKFIIFVISSSQKIIKKENKHNQYKQIIVMRAKLNINISKHPPTKDDIFAKGDRAKETSIREGSDAKVRVGYYAEKLRNARKSAGITQQQLADKIGKKREYVAMLEKGETYMQLSTFILISEAVGLKFDLIYECSE